MKPNSKNLIAALTASFLSSGTIAQAEDRAVIVGINIYEHAKDSNLNAARGDALKMRDFIRDDIGLRDDQITLLLDQAATRKKVIDTLVRDLKINTKPGDRLYFYFSGHGAQLKDRTGDEKDGKDEFIVLADFGKKGSPGILLDDELRYIFEYFPDRRIIVVVDACYSGTISRGEIPDEGELARTINLDPDTVLPPSFPQEAGLPPETGVRSRSTTLIPGQAHMDVWSAASQTQVAIEDNRGGVFTRLFLEGLGKGKADRNGNGRVSNAELLSYVRAGSSAFCKRSKLCKSKNMGRLTPEFGGKLERVALFKTPEVAPPPASTAPVQTAPAIPNAPIAESTPVPTAPAPNVPAPEVEPTPVEEPQPNPVETVETQTTVPQPNTDAPTTPASAPEDEQTTQSPSSQIGDTPVQPDTTATQGNPSGGVNIAQADPTVVPDFSAPVPLPSPSNSSDAPPNPVPAGPPAPVGVQDTALTCNALKTTSGTQILNDLFLPSGNAALRLSVNPGDRLRIGDTVRFDVKSNRDGQIVLFDLNPDCELFQIFPSVLSPSGAEVIDGQQLVEIPNALSTNGQPIEINVTDPAGRGHLVAVLVEDDIQTVTDRLPDYINLDPIPSGLDHLTTLADTLNLSLNDGLGPRASRWHAAIVPYTISR